MTRQQAISALVFICTLCASSGGVYAADAQETPMGPPPPPPTPPVVFSAHDDQYRCAEGAPDASASKNIEFSKKYEAKPNPRSALAHKFAEVISLPDAPFPQESHADSGYVTVQVAVSKEGRVIDFMFECSTSKVFHESISKTINAAKFKPATFQGKPIADVTIVSYRFSRH